MTKVGELFIVNVAHYKEVTGFDGGYETLAMIYAACIQAEAISKMGEKICQELNILSTQDKRSVRLK